MKKIKRVVFFLGTKFNQRDYHRFGFDIIQKRGYSVEAWNFTPWWRLDYAENYSPPDLIDFTEHKIFNTFNEIKTAISTLQDSDIVLDSFNICSNYNLGDINASEIGAMSCALTPTIKINKHERYFSYLHLIIFKPFQTLYKIKKKIIKKIIKDRSLNFLITSGKKSKNNKRHRIDKNTKIIKAHAYDYDRLLEEERNGNSTPFKLKDPFAVFLDEDIAFHPDYLHAGIKPYCTAERYYPEINKFFTEFEEKTDLKMKHYCFTQNI